MKVVIIGGGIAGLTLGILLHKRNIDTVINERWVGMPTKGHAFLMHGDGLSILSELSGDSKCKLAGNFIKAYSLRRPNGIEIKHLKLDYWRCLKRVDLISFLNAQYPTDRMKEGREFSHFIYKNENAVAAVFMNGEIEYGDIFVGSDGGNSMVRKSIFGQVKYSPIEVKEVVGIATNPKVAKLNTDTFTKFQDQKSGLAFGMIPASANEFVWFMQYDTSIADVSDNSPKTLSAFCKTQLDKFPEVVSDILDSNDFSTSYIWNTRDFDLLPAFHKSNVTLIGDSAHLALPFSSAGTTNAIIDAKTLAECLEGYNSYDKAFQAYYQLRESEVYSHIHLGRELKKQFLNPLEHSDDDIAVPLIKQKENDSVEARNKQIQVLYFTDPICSTCWIIQPLLRKLKLEYDSYINVKYCMGGLLPSWDDYNKGKIQKPTDAAKHWEEVCALHEMPLDGDVWLEDPINSSYPPSIAFKAAQMQDTSMAILFLRRIKEMVFVEKKNIIKWEFLENAAFEVGLDSARLLRDFNGKAKELFREDLQLAADLGVVGFPTLFFSDSANNQYVLKGHQPYESFEKIIYKLIPNAKKKEINADPENLFTIFPRMTDKEFAFLSNLSKDVAIRTLVSLWNNNFIDKYESKNGTIWISKFE
jgi:2-polyprenyl-6-methoxyphenol hydroxylase-like FAD-dependent oxidoreductase/predicted DsbA family dithiol-disulfide isomerase